MSELNTYQFTAFMVLPTPEYSELAPRFYFLTISEAVQWRMPIVLHPNCGKLFCFLIKVIFFKNIIFLNFLFLIEG